MKLSLSIFSNAFFDGAGKQRHEFAKRLRQFEHTDYKRGAENGQWFFIAYRHEAEYLQHPGVSEAIKRAAAYVPHRTTAEPGSDEYQAWFCDTEDCALYDVLFLDEVRTRFPNLAKWRGSALESMPEPDLSVFDEDWPALDEDPELGGTLDLLSPKLA